MVNIYCTYCTFTVQTNQEKIVAIHHETGYNTSRKDKRISIFKIPKAKSGIPEHEN